jgi:DNA polymerase, archaea type
MRKMGAFGQPSVFAVVSLSLVKLAETKCVGSVPMAYDPFIFGKDSTEHIVSCEVRGRTLQLFIEHQDGGVEVKEHPALYWLVSPTRLTDEWLALDGDLHYKYIRIYDDASLYRRDRQRYTDVYGAWDSKEGAAILKGFTYYKGMRPQDVSTLAFDIETTGLDPKAADARTLLISNTFRRNGITERKLFAFDDYSNDAAFFNAWSEWVRERNPSIVLGHNIYNYDLPYLQACAARAGTELTLGRDGSPLFISDYESRYRVDGSKDYTYKKAFIHGREIVDTYFLAHKYDIGRKYESYGLKAIIAHEGLEVPGRQHYDASQIAKNYQIPSEWGKIKAYAEHDADDALALFDLMVPAYFYLTQSVPKPFQSIINSASGAWLNSFLVRSYLQESHSIPKASEAVPFEGAISIGNPGIYRNVFKVDVASLYPSIILQYNVCDEVKDPKRHFLRMVGHFTNDRLANKRRAKETGDRHFSDLEQAQKIFINSSYGLLGAPGLNFNSPRNGARVTEEGRSILRQAMEWAATANHQLVNADTDSISISYKGIEWDEDMRFRVLRSLNSMMPTKIRWEDDGTYRNVLVLKAKNYVLDDGKKVKIKGSALKATTKEKALQEFIQRLISGLLEGCADLTSLYHEYVREILSLKDITRWSSKHTVTEAVLTSPRTNEAKKRAALSGSDYSMGDKVYLYFRSDQSLALREHWASDHCVDTLLEKLHSTLMVFEPVLDTGPFLNYSLKRNKRHLATLTSSI